VPYSPLDSGASYEPPVHYYEIESSASDLEQLLRNEITTDEYVERLKERVRVNNRNAWHKAPQR
jgi:hypothetical protein